MIEIKFERYWNDFMKKNEIKHFSNLDELEEWMFGQMQQDYTKNNRSMSFPTPDIMKRIYATEPWSIEFRPTYNGEDIWIHQISNELGIMFSDGEFTSGQKYWNDTVKNWLVHCEERRKNPNFKFV